ncbi:gylcine reductase operon associated protein GrdX [Gottschalkia purinilytica]|uniref:Gylcine reductase operon associated protein GrdX n=1 Tax=Gottschalkia purinilytica TaxID=1503 RepID=A0A0L0WF89_GOTPU|nr:GrdX family protein [Gottschalkia purinilytica]KNF10134.1 gylcine reductase operon associated protein GrdX [Gottschalkia purinilytica]
MNIILITNNPLVFEKYANNQNVEYYEVSYLEILNIIRDKIHIGHKLLTHPLSSSLKPNETPYKTVLITKEKYSSVDTDSIIIIESSILTAKKFIRNKQTPDWNQLILDDFQVVDLSLVDNVLSRDI